MIIQNTVVSNFDNAFKSSFLPIRICEKIEKSVPEKSYKEFIQAIKEKESGVENFLKQVYVSFDIRCSILWSNQAQKYSGLRVVFSQSLKNQLVAFYARLSLSQFFDAFSEGTDKTLIENFYDKLMEYTKIKDEDQKTNAYNSLIKNLPAGFEQWKSCTTNFHQLKKIYEQQQGKQDEWVYFCNWIENFELYQDFIKREKPEYASCLTCLRKLEHDKYSFYCVENASYLPNDDIKACTHYKSIY
ncbi:MAG: hypothetical protein ACRCZB_05525 [Bacteroidales bacterium]